MNMPLGLAQSISDMANGEFLDNGVLEMLCNGELLRHQKEVWLEDVKLCQLTRHLPYYFEDAEDYWKRLRELAADGGPPRKIVHLRRGLPLELGAHHPAQQREPRAEVRKEMPLAMHEALDGSVASDEHDLESSFHTILESKDVCATFTTLSDALLNIQNYCSNFALSVRVPAFDPLNSQQLGDFSMIIRLIGEFDELQRLTLTFT